MAQKLQTSGPFQDQGPSLLVFHLLVSVKMCYYFYEVSTFLGKMCP